MGAENVPKDALPKGQIVFILHGAKKLANKEMLGKSDPYALISFGNQVSKTKTIKNDLNPTWQHKVTFNLEDKSPSHINVEIFDDDFGKDQPLGNTSIELAEVMRVGNISSRPQKLSNCNSGEIIFSSNVVEAVVIEKIVDDKAKDIDKKQVAKPKTPVEDVET